MGWQSERLELEAFLLFVSMAFRSMKGQICLIPFYLGVRVKWGKLNAKHDLSCLHFLWCLRHAVCCCCPRLRHSMLYVNYPEVIRQGCENHRQGLGALYLCSREGGRVGKLNSGTSNSFCRSFAFIANKALHLFNRPK